MRPNHIVSSESQHQNDKYATLQARKKAYTTMRLNEMSMIDGINKLSRVIQVLELRTPVTFAS